jgi:hypothetical protein
VKIGEKIQILVKDKGEGLQDSETEISRSTLLKRNWEERIGCEVIYFLTLDETFLTLLVLSSYTLCTGDLHYVLYSGHWKGWAQKSLDFQGPPLPMSLVMMLHSSKPLRTAP